jgi:NAD(P)-dependent dehydrogenase (short-subunit alcohol dehydrogenase family)
MAMQDKTVVVTGATSGIGEVAALALAKQGARIVAVGRDKARGEAALAKLKSAGPSSNHTIHYADLSRLDDMKRVAGEIVAREPKIDVLINNAGAAFTSRQVTRDGLEMTFATNHMAYFVVTNLLLDRLKQTPGARIVSTASDAHSAGKLDFSDLQSEKRYSTFRAYGTSKLCNILFTRELSRRLAGSGATANCLHPGFVNTRIGDNNKGIAWIARIVKLFALSPAEGAETIVYLASSPEVAGKSGGYYIKSRLATPNADAQNDANARRLWEESARISGVG